MAWICLGVIVIGGYLGGPRVIHAIKGWQARRVAAQASQLIDHDQLGAAAKKVQEAMQLRGTDPVVWAVAARFLSRVGQSEAAVRWWLRLEQTRPLSEAERTDLITSALANNDLDTAGRELDQVLHLSAPATVDDNLLAAQYAAARGDEISVRRMATKALADTSVTPRQTVAALALIMAYINPSDDEARSAFERVIAIARDPSNPASLDALTVLGQTLLDPKADTAKLANSGLINSSEVAARLDQDQSARPLQRTLALELRAQSDPAHEKDLVKEAILKYGRVSDDMTAALCQWLYLHHEYDAILRILPVEKAGRSRDLLMQRLDSLAQLGKYDELKAELLNENPVLPPSLQHALLAVVTAKLGQTSASDNEWERAVAEGGDDPQKLMTVGNFAEAKGNFGVAADAYERVRAREPDRRMAYLAGLRVAHVMADTQKAHELATGMVKRWPEDRASRLNEIYLRLLIDPSSETAKAAEKEIAALLAADPDDVSARKTMSLALLREGRGAAALDILPQPKPNDVPYPVLAAAWQANGWRQNAQKEARKLTTARLFPEERALIANIH